MSLEVWKIVASFILAIIVVIMNKVWDPIAERVGYPLDVPRRVKKFIDAARMLREIQGDLFLLHPNPWSERCEGWLQRVCLKADKIEAGHNRCGLTCYFRKCYLAKEADHELEKAIDLVRTGKELLKEAQARPHAVRRVLPQHPQIQLWGMDSYKHKVCDFIQDDSSSSQSGLLGIWGMAGVGKTSLLEFVRDSHSPAVQVQAPFFDHVLFVRAGSEVSIGKAQRAIAASMGLPVMPDDDEISQESIIYNHLKDKSFLLLIDDLWAYHDLKHVGIPMPLGKVLCPSHGGGLVREYQRKVVFTTRSYDVCGPMACANNAIRLKCLSKDDAWKLFEDKVGKEIINDPQLQKLARKVRSTSANQQAQPCYLLE